jgi:hypothetical protein
LPRRTAMASSVYKCQRLCCRLCPLLPHPWPLETSRDRCQLPSRPDIYQHDDHGPGLRPQAVFTRTVLCFFKTLLSRRPRRRAAKQKPTLSIEEHVVNRAQLNDVLFIKPKYSDQTEINVAGIFRKWVWYIKLSR